MNLNYHETKLLFVVPNEIFQKSVNYELSFLAASWCCFFPTRLVNTDIQYDLCRDQC